MPHGREGGGCVNLEWMNQAECRNHDPELFFPSGDQHYMQVVREARKVCMVCPVQLECDRYATETEQRDGVWAGRLRVGPAKSYKEIPPHGTEARAQRHRRQNQAPCTACLNAERAARRLRERTA